MTKYLSKLLILPQVRLVCSLLISVSIVLPSLLSSPPLANAQGTIIVVNTTDDELNSDGDCTLREAIQAANTNSMVDACSAGSSLVDTIELPAGSHLFSLPGAGEDNNSTGDLDIKSDLTINGAGANSSIIDGNQLDRVLHIHNDVMVTLNDVEITNGQTTDGGFDFGAIPGAPGAGIYNAGILILNRSSISHNITGDGSSPPDFGFSGPGGSGGGIYNSGTLTINNSKISDNLTGNGGTSFGVCPVGGAGGTGGGIHNGGGIVILNDSMVSNNTTGNGGVSNCPYTGFGGHGGGIYNSLGTLILHSSVISGNITGAGGDPNSGGFGGGIASAGILKLNNSLIRNNMALGGGGGLALSDPIGNNSQATLLNNAIIDNQTEDFGSGIYIQGTEASLLHTTLARNSGGDGSGVYIDTDMSNSYGTVVLTNTILVSTTVGVYVTPANTAVFDGVLWFGNGTNTSGAGTITILNEYTGNPAFATDGYHLTGASAAIDRGVTAGVGSDIDQEPRIQGAPDLGADELITISIKRAYLPTVLK